MRNNEINKYLTNITPNLTAIVLFPTLLSVSTSRILFIHKSVTDRHPITIPEIRDSTET